MKTKQSELKTPISAQAIRLHRAIKESDGRVLNVTVDDYQISIYMDWRSLKELASSSGLELMYKISGGYLKAEINKGELHYWATRKTTHRDIELLAGLNND